MENAVTVDFATADGTAHAGQDYVATSGTLTFAPHERARTVSVTVNADGVVEPAETFSLNLSNESMGTMVDGQAIGTIADGTPPPPPLLRRHPRRLRHRRRLLLLHRRRRLPHRLHRGCAAWFRE